MKYIPTVFMKNHTNPFNKPTPFQASELALILVQTHLVLPIFNGIIKQLAIPKNQTSL